MVFLGGCSTSKVVPDVDVQARRHMAIADSLERSSLLSMATLEYQIVAEQFPSSSVYPAAARKTALLFGSPENSAANDSASLYWLQRYAEVSPSPEEKQVIQMYLAVVSEVRALRDSLSLKGALVDSLAALARKQATDATARIRRIQELDTELQKASNELRKLKEVDEQISKSRGKKAP